METGERRRADKNQKLLDSIVKELPEEAPPPDDFRCESCIFRVPKLMREVMSNAYEPMVVSIGPYHCMKERLRPMNTYKLGRLKLLTYTSSCLLLLPSCLEVIKKEETRIREYYADPIDLSSDEFTRMVLLDSVFIIQFLIRSTSLSVRLGNNAAFEGVWIHEIKRDMLLLENQLPLFILDQIYNLAYPPNSKGQNFDRNFRSVVDGFFLVQSMNFWEDCNHLLDVVWHKYGDLFKCSEREEEEEGSLVHKVSPTVTRLHAAGVKLQVADYTEVPCIKFDSARGILSIPKLETEDPTQSIFRNMMALEQCKYFINGTTHITDYFYFLNCLINTPKDVQLLSDAGIVDNWHGSEAVCFMFNNICNNISHFNHSYSGLSKQLNNHYNKASNYWNRHIYTLKEKYIEHPWAVISVVYAILLMVFTIAQVALAYIALPG